MKNKLVSNKYNVQTEEEEKSAMHFQVVFYMTFSHLCAVFAGYIKIFYLEDILHCFK